MPRASVIIPAHNEEQVIERTLARLTDGMSPDEFEILVVCNGCTDRTAELARAAAPSARVLDLPQPSKFQAIRRGDAATTVTPRVYLDADVVVHYEDVRALLAALVPGVLAVAPRRALDLHHASWSVRWYYEVWERLPQVRDGAFGRGVIAVSEAGLAITRPITEVLSDDLAFAEALAHQTVVVDDAVVRINVPRTLRALMRRRIRIATGNAQADLMGWRSASSKTSVRVLVGILRDDPRIAPKLVVFLGVGILSRSLARRAVRSKDFGTWLRDDTSRDHANDE